MAFFVCIAATFSNSICTVRVINIGTTSRPNISAAKINVFELRFKSYDPWDMASCLIQFLLKIEEIEEVNRISFLK